MVHGTCRPSPSGRCFHLENRPMNDFQEGNRWCMTLADPLLGGSPWGLSLGALLSGSPSGRGSPSGSGAQHEPSGPGGDCSGILLSRQNYQTHKHTHTHTHTERHHKNPKDNSFGEKSLQMCDLNFSPISGNWSNSNVCQKLTFES